MKKLLLSITILVVMLFFFEDVSAQKKNQMVRLAKIKVDSAQLEQYNIALNEQMKTAVTVEPGVLTYYAVADKSDPTQILYLKFMQTRMLTKNILKHPILRNTQPPYKTWLSRLN